MGISRDSRHKRRATGGRRNVHKKKRQYEMARQGANTKLGAKRVRTLRVRGGNTKYRALRLDTGNFSWGTEVCTRKARILDVLYNASNNELVRTKTLVKNCIVSIDATPFRQWYEAHYGVEIGRRGALGRKKAKKDAAEAAANGPKKQSSHVKRTRAQRQKDRELADALDLQFASGRIMAAISSRPGQSGRADGYILEGEELKFYTHKLAHKGK